MIHIYLVLSAAALAGLVAEIIFLAKKENDVKYPLLVLHAAAILATVFNVSSVMLDGEMAATMAHSLYFAAADWLALGLLLFTYRFVGYEGDARSKIQVWGLLSVIDTVSMMINPWLGHIFECERVELAAQNFECYAVKPVGGLYYLRLCFCYAMILVSVYTLIRTAVSAVPLYRFRYVAVLCALSLIAGLNFLYHMLKLNIDLSPIFYFVSAVTLTYFSMFYVPRRVEVGLITASVRGLKTGIICFDRDGKCTYFNDSAKAFFGTDQKERLEDFLLTWSADRQSEELEKNIVWPENRELEDGIHNYEVHYHPMKDSKGSFIGCCFAVNDRTQEQRSYEREHFRATHDELTGLNNRRGFFEKARIRLDTEKETKWVIVCTDIKDFKLINDLFGVKTGDTILIHIAEMIRREAGPISEFGRLSGDRFAMLIPKSRFSEEKFEGYARELSKLAENEVYRMHIHVGVYPVENRKLEVSIMCDRAFLAIQRIKNNYQKVISYYDAGLGNQQIAEKRMLAEFESALQGGQFKMFLQPQIAADQNQKLLGAEALVRWTHPVKGMISPGSFIPIFEQAGLIYKLDYYIWETACARLKKWKEQGRDDLHISVNISQKDFYYMDLYQSFTGLVEKYGISPSKLKLEITETALMSELKQQLGLLDRLRKYGFHIEIDDFGSGYSSLNTLKDIEVDVLKLDMGFLSTTTHEDRSKTIMNSVISMSKQLGLTVITEGVETFEQVEYLRGTGCDMFQGYYFAKPMAVENFEERYMEEDAQ